MLSNLPNKTVLGGRWETVNLLGEGACAQVYKVKDTQNKVSFEVVAKVVPFAKGKNKVQERICNTLNYEYVMYNGLLSGFPYRPQTPDKFYGDDKTHQVRYLVMERMDRDLIAYSNSTAEVNSSRIARIGLDILRGLEWIHQKGFLFIDVKPDNFMLKGDNLHFVDFGLVERLVVVQPGQTPPKREFAGTPTFCSVAAHRGDQPSAHDDLEAMGMVLLSLTSGGRLPWSTAKSDAECLTMKESCDVRKLCAQQGVPELADVILQCRGAARHVRPDYSAIQAVLTRMRDRKVTAVSIKGGAAGGSSGSSAEPAPAASTSKGRGRGAKKATPVDLTADDEGSETEPAPLAKAAKTSKSSKPEPVAAPVVPLKRAGAASKKAAVAAAGSHTAPEQELLEPARSVTTSPVAKRSRRAEATAAAAAEVPADAPFSAPGSSRSAGAPKRVRASPAGKTPATAGPFSGSSSSSAVAAEGLDPHARTVSSPALATRSRAAAPFASPAPADALSGPFSAAYISQGAGGAASKNAKRATTSPSPAAAAACVIRVTKGGDKGLTLEVPVHQPSAGSASKRGRRSGPAEVVYTVGRGDNCDLRLSKDDYLSEKHFRVVASEEGVSIRDEGSTNGTKLNNAKITRPMLLQHGDKISVGTTSLVVEFRAP